jgi:hypothetical protein
VIRIFLDYKPPLPQGNEIQNDEVEFSSNEDGINEKTWKYHS